MSLLTGLDLRRMRRTADSSLPDSVAVWRRTLSADGRGGATTALARVSTVRGRFAPLTTVQSVEQVYADRLGGNQGWWFTTPIGTDIRMDDQLRATSRTFEVVSLDAGRTWDISLRALCRELT